MSEVFRGWRRKTGCVTLMMALVFVGGWIRSFVVEDFIDFQDFIRSPIQNGALAGLSTEGHSLALMAFDNYRDTTPAPLLPSSTSVSSGTSHSEEVRNIDSQDDPPATVSVRTATAAVDLVPIVVIPYWSITIPLTFLSAYLLLAKARPSTQKKPTERISVEGA